MSPTNMTSKSLLTVVDSKVRQKQYVLQFPGLLSRLTRRTNLLSRQKGLPPVIHAKLKERNQDNQKHVRDSSSVNVRSSIAIIIDAGLVSKLH